MEITIELIQEREKEELVISKHAYARMKERNGWSKKTATRMIQKVYQNTMLTVLPVPTRSYLLKEI